MPDASDSFRQGTVYADADGLVFYRVVGCATVMDIGERVTYQRVPTGTVGLSIHEVSNGNCSVVSFRELIARPATGMEADAVRSAINAAAAFERLP